MNSSRPWSDLRVGVLGLGRSGRAATRLLIGAGAAVYASDSDDSETLRRQTSSLAGPGVEIELGRHDASKLALCDLLVASPGIPPSAGVFNLPGVKGRPVISELELAYRFLDAPVIAVSGTNGKTTTAAWIGELILRAGMSVGVGGNIGRALSELAANREIYDWVVAEVSSFQLSKIESFKPAIGILLNLCPDHLDWHVSVENYYGAKARLFDNANSESRWVLNGEDQEVLRLARDRPGTAGYFRVASRLPSQQWGAYLGSGGMLTLRWDDSETELVPRRALKLLGGHNVANALATAVGASFAGLPVEAMREGLREFEPLPHRLQPVGEVDDVLWVNDSKATNVASTRVALQAMDRPVVLLLGGRGKGESFAPLLPHLASVRVVIGYGEAAAQIESELAGEVRVVEMTGSFDEVVKRASAEARAGDVLLLSPACASFDMFRDYEERGDRFARLAAEGSR